MGVNSKVSKGFLGAFNLAFIGYLITLWVKKNKYISDFNAGFIFILSIIYLITTALVYKTSKKDAKDAKDAGYNSYEIGPLYYLGLTIINSLLFIIIFIATLIRIYLKTKAA
uniref:Uncharacterized protein n=1 Tax=viral metagenome TaxID=1070528 RepID=A0A6C0HVQ7_9ZZZZ